MEWSQKNVFIRYTYSSFSPLIPPLPLYDQKETYYDEVLKQDVAAKYFINGGLKTGDWKKGKIEDIFIGQDKKKFEANLVACHVPEDIKNLM